VLYFEAFDCLQLLQLLLSIIAASCPGSYSFRFLMLVAMFLCTYTVLIYIYFCS